MDDFILKITAEIVITQEDVDDIMSTVLDSSTLQCWCSEVNVVGKVSWRICQRADQQRWRVGIV